MKARKAALFQSLTTTSQINKMAAKTCVLGLLALAFIASGVAAFDANSDIALDLSAGACTAFEVGNYDICSTTCIEHHQGSIGVGSRLRRISTRQADVPRAAAPVPCCALL